MVLFEWGHDVADMVGTLCIYWVCSITPWFIPHSGSISDLFHLKLGASTASFPGLPLPLLAYRRQERKKETAKGEG